MFGHKSPEISVISENFGETTKLIYGLESAVFSDNAKKKLDTFQLKGLRKILKLTTTHIHRSNTNEYVYELANKEADYPEGREIKTLSDYHTERNIFC